MPRNFKLNLPATGSFTGPQVMVRAVLGILLAANLIAAGFAFHVFDASPEALTQQLTAAISQRQTEQARLVRSRLLTANIQKGKTEGETFLANYMTSRRVTYSTIIGELTETAKAAGMEKPGATIALEPIPGTEDLDMMSVSLNLEGNYAQLVRFVNLLDRSARFLIIETLTVAPRAKTDTLTVNVKLDTFVRDDKGGIS